MRRVSLARLVENEAQDMLDLGLAAALDVAQHRRRVLRVALRERLLPRPHKALAGGVTVGGGDRGTALQLLEEKFAAVGGADNLANIRAHQAGHGSGRREMNQLFPHSLND